MATGRTTRVEVGSVSFLEAAGSGYGIGLDDDGHLVEFLGDWRAMRELEQPLAEGERAAFLRAAAVQPETER